MFSPDDEKTQETPAADSSCSATIGTNPTPGTEKDMDFNSTTTDADGHKVYSCRLKCASFIKSLRFYVAIAVVL